MVGGGRGDGVTPAYKRLRACLSGRLLLLLGTCLLYNVSNDFFAVAVASFFLPPLPFSSLKNFVTTDQTSQREWYGTRDSRRPRGHDVN